MFIKLAVLFCVVLLLGDVNGSPFTSSLFDAVKKPAEIAKDTIQQPLQPILGAFGAPTKRQSRASQDDSSSGSPSGLFDIVKKPAEAIKDAFQPILGAFGAPLNRGSRATDDSDSKKKDDDQEKDDDKKKDDDQKSDDKKNGGKQPFQPIFDLFGNQVERVSGAFSALLSPSSSNKQ